MYLINKSNKAIVLSKCLAGTDLHLRPGERSKDFVPNKKILNQCVTLKDSLEMHVTSGSDINIATEIDPRVETLIILD